MGRGMKGTGKAVRRKARGRRRGVSLRVTSFALARGRGAIRLILGDCIREMTRLKPKSVDVVVTSPPYNAGKDYGAYDDRIPRPEYLRWTRQWAERLVRVLSDRGSLFLNIGARPADPWVAFDVLSVFRDLLVLQNVIHWVKSIAIEPQDMRQGTVSPETVTFGHYQPIQSARYLNAGQEYVFHLTHAGDVRLDRLAIGVPYKDKSNVTRWKAAARDVHCRGNTWFIPYQTIQSRDKERPHPATFPEKLPEMCLRLHGLRRIRRAMDPFVGLGSTAVACARIGVPFIGFEIDREYLAESARRVRGALEEARGRGR